MQHQIKPGLQRITRLLHGFKQAWPAIHVAGTNGKGSVCAYITAMLRHAGVKTGRFISPHLIDRWDGITINDRVVRRDLFEEQERQVRAIDEQEDIGASSFEKLTATAFHVFNEEKIDMGVIECGMGGREDATNVVQNTAVSIITNIGLDHQDFLGSTVQEIAHHKAGILRAGVPYLNGADLEAQKVIKEEATRVGAIAVQSSIDPWAFKSWGLASEIPICRNMALALSAVEVSSPNLVTVGNLYFKEPYDDEQRRRELASAIPYAVLPGRMQMISLKSLINGEEEALIDGAHNEEAWRLLRSHVDRRLRTAARSPGERAETPTGGKAVTWILAQSSSPNKSPSEMIKTLCRRGDTVFVTSFGSVEGMPWVKPAPSEAYALNEIQRVRLRKFVNHPEGGLSAVLRDASNNARGRPLVITGSLYLVSDVMRRLRDDGHDPRRVEENSVAAVPDHLKDVPETGLG